jgi:hypothetical protein
MNTTKTDFFHFAHSRSQYEHEQLSEGWRQLDNKAQSTAAIGGVFMAATFAFLQSSSVKLVLEQKIGLSVVVILLVISISLAVFSMLIEDIPMPPTSSNVARMVTDALRQNETELTERFIGLLADTIDPWIQVNDTLIKKIKRKGEKVKWSQYSLLFAAISLSLLTISVLTCKGEV